MAGLSAGLLVVQLGCHTYRPMQGIAPAVGREVAVELNDRGRLVAAGQLGESVWRIDGSVVALADSSLTMRVMRTVMVRGSSAIWSGESVTIPRSGIQQVLSREFSRERTVAVVVGAVGVVALLAKAINLLPGGTPTSEVPIPCVPPGCIQQ